MCQNVPVTTTDDRTMSQPPLMSQLLQRKQKSHMNQIQQFSQLPLTSINNPLLYWVIMTKTTLKICIIIHFMHVVFCDKIPSLCVIKSIKDSFETNINAATTFFLFHKFLTLTYSWIYIETQNATSVCLIAHQKSSHIALVTAPKNICLRILKLQKVWKWLIA